MTLHPVPFSVGVSLGLSLGTVPESELINPSLKTQTLLRKASQQMHVHPILSDFIQFHPYPCSAPDEAAGVWAGCGATTA